MPVDPEYQQLDDIITLTSDLAYSGKWDELDKIMAELDMNLPLIQLLGWARYTVPMRSKCQNWQNMIHRIRDEFNSRGEDTERLLGGLL